MRHEISILIIGLFVVLSTASVTSGILSMRAPKPLSATLVNLTQRINAWWVMVALMTVAFFFGRYGMTILFALISFAALREFVTLTHSRRSDHWVLLGMFGIVIPVQYWLVWTAWYGLFVIFIPVYCFLLMPAITALHGDTERFLERVSAQQWAIMISVYCVSHVPALLTLNVPGFEGRNLLLIAFLIIVVQGSDVLQYIFGKLFGKHRFSPTVSPSKTWEGLIGGLVASSLLGALLAFITPFSPLQASAVAFIACAMGFLGGLVASAIKRDQGVKDWGHLIEGHGGMLDRTDSLVFAAPIFFHIVRYFWTV
ncbi:MULTISPECIES: phosphatidate cytidylyltransferase [unclassified Mesorhizobium]|uniref:phosphatidate cytidylyltransferase n=1 Tax=unclassified Mesorhizobium TaxID=325217 RepID=UPI000BAF04BB|nr:MULTISPECIES: phosphatidate cytidylyltransferase [unclassified Mesorhizobium]TGT56744.1 phosphatidate cytidylyltransferase [Mesorhizobium sp. M00.F.Ca.ET.170.01.1.1]AZO08512.1 phosphatidate cytidylyltransferase [Mesorhizobium sp. M3A.F.Ca.ET.080.04.2.1]PBB85388.1 phosphatidate cytidylyltransferase [Mesorhizobium sp. WSM3876]RWB71629.1 MAG: phosphatidate cytidylyltransferase [Mesorhizobium sp.]RWB85118.1 MAG: phosphatidate cytidylyltransferase [Mesorhizobium sp.]